MQISFHGFEKTGYVRDVCSAFLGDVKVCDTGEGLAISLNRKDGLEYAVTLDDGAGVFSGKSRLSDLSMDTPLRAAVRALYFALREMTGKELPWGTLTGVRPTKLYWEAADLGLRREEIARMFREVFLVSPVKTEKLMKTAKAQKDLISEGNEGLHLYISIPFCPSRCSYCSFISNSVQKNAPLLDGYIDYLLKELDIIASVTEGITLPFKSIYVGGGTPSVLSEGNLLRLLQRISALFWREGMEYSFEAGRPDTVTDGKLALIREYGVNRISINPQSLNDATLKAIGRNHTVQDVYDAFEKASKYSFHAINSDLIAGLPGETTADFERTINEMMVLHPENLTVHTLSFKRGSNLWEGKERDGLIVREMLDYADERLEDNGYLPYYLYRQKNMRGNFENTGYAKKDTACRYNIVTMEENQSIIGAGAGAISKLVPPSGLIRRIANAKYPAEYMDGFEKYMSYKGLIVGYLK